MSLATSYVGSIIADGGTAHEEALSMALRLGADTIFFLTDADQPVLSPAELERIWQLNGGRAVIHAIEFGRGPSLLTENFLRAIARANSGRYTYVDVSRSEPYLLKNRP
jgi:hypothetical protein